MPGVCPRCLREVYFAEEKLALGKVWHTFCFTCRNCRKLLDSCTLATHAEEIFCRNCYLRLFSPIFLPVLSVSSTRGKREITETKKRGVTPLKNSTSDYFSDCCCCCSEDCPFTIKKGEIPNSKVCQLEKSSFQGGGEEEIFHLEGKNECCERKNSNLGVVSSIISVCNPLQISSNSNAGHWINHQSASQSTFDCQSCNKSQLVRPSSTSSTGIPEVCRRFNNINCNNSQTRLRRPGSPCRISNQYSIQEKIDQKQNQFLQYKISKSDKAGPNKKPPQPALSVGFFSKILLSLPHHQHHHKEENFSPTSLKSKRKINHSSREYLAYPPLPPHYTPPPRRVSFCKNKAENTCTYDDQEGHLTMRNFAKNADSLKEDYTSSSNLDIENSNFCDCNVEAEENDRIKLFNRTYTSLETIHEDYCNGRMRGGCGGGGGSSCCGGKSRYERDVDGDYDHEGELDGGRRSARCGSSSGSGAYGCSLHSIKKQFPKSGDCCSKSENNQEFYGHGASHDRQRAGCCLRSEESQQIRTAHANQTHTNLYERCPPAREPDDACNSLKTTCSVDDACSSPPCSERKGCCSPVGSRPLCNKKSRCHPPCKGNNNKCGGGGCCGSGCRGGCGKPGQQCLPTRFCTNPLFQSSKFSGGSPCLSPKFNARQPPPSLPCCKTHSQAMRISENSGRSGYRSKTPAGGCNTGDGSCFQKDEQENDDFDTPKLPSGCECFGGGMDCQRCGRKVYHAEMQIASGVPFHNICFSCFCCRKPLESLTYQENCGEIYCKQCYIRNFGPQGYGYGIGAGVLQTPM